MIQQFSRFCGQTNLVLVVDHAGRAGNGFFQTIFDNHEEVAACPWLHYVFSYLFAQFGDNPEIPVAAIREKWIPSRYFGLLYHDISPESERLIKKMGGEDSERLNRQIFRESFESVLSGRKSLPRKTLVSAIFFSYTLAVGRNPLKVRLIMVADSVSLREETVLGGFSGRAIDCAMADFPEAIFLHLERDPRAGIASSRHQFVNQLGNAHASRLGLNLSQIQRLWLGDLGWDGPYVFGFWLAYFLQTYRTVTKLRARYSENVVTVKNEDLNLNFTETMVWLADSLAIRSLPEWGPRFVPTMLGVTWKGTGAYNSRYQTATSGPLMNDSTEVSDHVTGPNEYVTKRWRGRLSRNEVQLVELFLKDELEAFSYDFLYPLDCKKLESSSRRKIWKLNTGELPTVQWIWRGRSNGPVELVDRLTYAGLFPLFYVLSRTSFLRVARKAHFLPRCVL